MSTLLKQVAEPHDQSTPKKRRHRHPERTPVCKCGMPKERRAIQCRACRTKSGKSPERPESFLINGELCRYISLTQGQYAIVDETRFTDLNKFSIYAVWNPCTNSFYAKSSQAVMELYGEDGMITLAALVLSLPPGTLIDHANGNTLDNRKSNLRPATKRQNAMNRKLRKGSKQPYIGILFDKRRPKPWGSKIWVNGKIIYGKYCLTPADAAKARDVLAKTHFGSFARLNFPDSLPYHPHAIQVAPAPVPLFASVNCEVENDTT